MLNEIIQTIPVESGSYALCLCLSISQEMVVGKLGRFTFPAGDYIYLGSACGPGGLRARLGRHLRGNGQPHWHIDHLRAVAQVIGFGCKTSSPKECVWSQKLAIIPEASIPVLGFGASDCHLGCAAHLIHFRSLDLEEINALLDCSFGKLNGL